MALSIYALNRGGWSAHGQGHFDARAYPGGAVVLDACGSDEELSTTITFDETISSITASANGVSATTPTLSTSTATCELSGMDGGGYVEFLATLASGQKRKLRIYASGQAGARDYVPT